MASLCLKLARRAPPRFAGVINSLIPHSRSVTSSPAAVDLPFPTAFFHWRRRHLTTNSTAEVFLEYPKPRDRRFEMMYVVGDINGTTEVMILTEEVGKTWELTHSISITIPKSSKVLDSCSPSILVASDGCKFFAIHTKHKEDEPWCSPRIPFPEGFDIDKPYKANLLPYSYGFKILLVQQLSDSLAFCLYNSADEISEWAKRKAIPSPFGSRACSITSKNACSLCPQEFTSTKTVYFFLEDGSSNTDLLKYQVESEEYDFFTYPLDESLTRLNGCIWESASGNLYVASVSKHRHAVKALVCHEWVEVYYCPVHHLLADCMLRNIKRNVKVHPFAMSTEHCLLYSRAGTDVIVHGLYGHGHVQWALGLVKSQENILYLYGHGHVQWAPRTSFVSDHKDCHRRRDGLNAN